MEIIKNNKTLLIVAISRKFKSYTFIHLNLKSIPNKTLNQHLLKPTRPITLATKINKHVKFKDNSDNPKNIKISAENFKVPGSPE